MMSAVTSGNYVEPTLFTDVINSMRIAQEEFFGTVGAVAPFETAKEAFAIANDSLYGLAATNNETVSGISHLPASLAQTG